MSAGLAHWSLVRLDLAVQRRQVILPPAVDRYLNELDIAIFYPLAESGLQLKL